MADDLQSNVEHGSWTDVVAQIRRLLEAYAGLLSPEARQGVEHFLSHDEYEMAFEGLTIELMTLKEEISPDDRRCCVSLARRLGLVQDSVFDPNFWTKLSRFEAGHG